MKLKIGEKVYLQKYDAKYLLGHLGIFPENLYSEIFSQNDGVFFMNAGTDAMSFTIVFEDQENVDWLMAQDFIPDFEELSKESVEDLQRTHDGLAAATISEMESFNDMPSDYREKHFREKQNDFSFRGFKSFSISMMIDYLNGKAKFTFPKEYRKSDAKNLAYLVKYFIERALNNGRFSLD